MAREAIHLVGREALAGEFRRVAHADDQSAGTAQAVDCDRVFLRDEVAEQK
jgi:hypothetical protein